MDSKCESEEIENDRRYRYEDEIEDFEEACAALQIEEHIFCVQFSEAATQAVLGDNKLLRPPQLLLVRVESPLQFAKKENVAWVSMLAEIGNGASGGDVSIRYLALSEPIEQGIPLDKWILRYSLPLVSEIRNLNFAMYDKSKLPMVMLFYNPDKPAERRLIRTFREAAKRLQDQVCVSSYIKCELYLAYYSERNTIWPNVFIVVCVRYGK